MTQHTDKYYERELIELKDMILKASGVIEEMLAGSIKALVERKSDLAEEVIAKDAKVNQLEMEIDERCLQMLALRQPAGSDLRFITIGLKISKDLERLGDLAVNIAEEAIDLNREPQLKPYIDLPRMGEETQRMVKLALDAFVAMDVTKAQEVCESDDKVDDLDQLISDELLQLMQKDPAAVSRSMRIITVVKQLERIADHATNIAETVFFMVEGKDIRHRKRGV